MLVPMGVGLLLLGVGAYAAGTAFSMAETAVEGWAATGGEILSSALVTHEIRVDRLEQRRPGSAVNPDAFRPVWDLEVRYLYRVGDHDYHGSVLSNIARHRREDARTHPPSDELRDLARRFAAGNRVEVRYDPARPQDAVLLADRLPQADWLRRGGLAGVLLGMASLGLAAFRRARG
ncbi:DUF3592 domain-containing protein [Niveispirillum sp. KHB5.9]|uniref:DUF3592 domain-containing protein n=1 Tax=Niveispirillum sp. KHB5.9 TaxID=3400269 RepID=UPI003A8A4DFD